MFFIKVLLNLPDFIYCTNYFPIVDWDNTLGLPINLFIFDLAYFIGTSLILWSNLSYKKLLLIFLNQKWLYTCFFYLRTYTNPSLLLDAMLQALIRHLFSFILFVLFRSIIPSHKSNMSNSSRIKMVVNTNIVKV